MSFVHATFLAAAAAVTIPWLIHMTRKRKYLRIRLGSLQFLDPLVRDRQRMSRVENWPLLLLRCLAILLLAFVFSRPFFSTPEAAPPAAGETVLLLDASGSITPAQADAIRKQARKNLAGLPESTRPILAAVSDRVEILPSLDAYQPVPGAPGEFATAVDWLVDRASSTPDSMAKVHWFSDLQRSALPSAPGRLWPSGIGVEIHPALPEGDRNAAVEQIDLLTPFGTDTWEIEARVRVYGIPGDKPLTLSLATSDGKTQSASCPAEGGTVRFKWEGSAPKNLLSGTVALKNSKDPWPADDMHPFAFSTRSPKRIALVDGDPGKTPFTGEAYFLEKAIHASASGKALSPFRATISTSLPAAEDAVDAIALCNVASLSPTDARLLRTHLDRGCGIAIFAGDKTVPASWTAAVTEGLLPNGIEIVQPSKSALIAKTDLIDPALSGLSVDSARGLGSLPLTQRFTWPANAGWKTLMTLDSGAPVLAVSANGRVALFAQQANREGSDLPLDPAFVPLMQGLFSQLTKGVAADPGAPSSIETLVPGLAERRAPGIYPRDAGTTLIAADASESDIASADEKSFRSQLGLPAIDAPPPTLNPPMAALGSNQQREGELWPWILVVLLSLLIVENGLAARRPRQLSTSAPHAS